MTSAGGVWNSLTKGLDFQPTAVGVYKIDLQMPGISDFNIYSFTVTVYQNTAPVFTSVLTSPQTAQLGVNTFY